MCYVDNRFDSHKIAFILPLAHFYLQCIVTYRQSHSHSHRHLILTNIVTFIFYHKLTYTLNASSIILVIVFSIGSTLKSLTSYSYSILSLILPQFRNLTALCGFTYRPQTTAPSPYQIGLRPIAVVQTALEQGRVHTASAEYLTAGLRYIDTASILQLPAETELKCRTITTATVTYDTHGLPESGAVLVRFFQGGRPLRFRLALELLASDEESGAGAQLRDQLTAALMSFDSWGQLFWECPPLSTATWEQRVFEFVVMPAGDLGSADPSSFRDHFDGAKGPLVTQFWNLGRDALLVCPCPFIRGEETGAGGGFLIPYGNLLQFLRSAPVAAVHALWLAVAVAVAAEVEGRPDCPVWVSTHGAGVPWLHVRVSLRPKYYHYQPFTKV